MRQLTLLLFCCLFFCSNSLHAQEFIRLDSLRGSITPERAWWDLQHYDLSVSVSIEDQSLTGQNIITYKTVSAYLDDSVRHKSDLARQRGDGAQDHKVETTKRFEPKGPVIQIDLQDPMKIDSVLQNGVRLDYIKEGPVHWIKLKESHELNKEYSLTCYFSGAPIVANNPPWDGGFTWDTDEIGRPFIANANQGIGASVWWPNKDHPSDEPDRGIDLKITVPKPLVAVGNGRLIDIDSATANHLKYHWRVTAPINNYGVNVNIGHYVNFSEQYSGLDGNLDCTYWVLDYNLEQAQAQFSQVPMMLEAFEHWFGPYPFYNDGYQLVEVPYLGMEHQSSVTYGNGYRNGYRGTDLSDSGWGMTFDFIIIHESGHEWFANNITNKDVADMWIHEGFTAYSENLFLDYFHGKEASSAYVVGTKKRIRNDRPLIGTYDVNHEGSGDMYYKGANILHTLRQLIEDDQKWREILIGLNREFRHQTVTSAQVEAYITKESGIDLKAFWDQYLRTAQLPLLTYTIDGNEIKFKYDNVIDGFDMPVRALINGMLTWLYPNKSWQTYSANGPVKTFVLDENFLVIQGKI